MSTFKQTLTTNWHASRVIRVLFGLILAYQALSTADLFAGFVSAFFLYQGITNTGCCGAGSCSTGMSDYEGNEPNSKVSFEEIKVKNQDKHLQP